MQFVGCQSQIIDFDWQYLYLNAAAATHNRRPNSELLGHIMTECGPGIEQTEVFRMLDITERKLHEFEVQRHQRLYATLSAVNQAIVRLQDRQQLFDTVCKALVSPRSATICCEIRLFGLDVYLAITRGSQLGKIHLAQRAIFRTQADGG